jgi:hypothetical protein
MAYMGLQIETGLRRLKARRSSLDTRWGDRGMENSVDEIM